MSKIFSDAVHDASIGERLGGDSIPVDRSSSFDPFAKDVHTASTGEWLTGGSQAVHEAGLGDLDATSVVHKD